MYATGHLRENMDIIMAMTDRTCICSAQCRNRDNSGIVLRKVGIPTLFADSGIVPDNSRIAQGIHVVVWSDMVSAQSRNRRGQSKNLKGRIR